MHRALRIIWPYLLAAAGIAFAASLRVALIPVIGTNTAYLTAFPMVALIAAILGVCPGLFAAMLAVLFLETYLFEPFGVVKFSTESMVRGSTMLITAAIIGNVAWRLHTTSRRAEREAAAARRSAEDARQARMAAEQANMAKTHFLATISHELRTPLNAIFGFSNLLMRGTLRDAERHEFKARIDRNAAHLSRLIDDVLNISRIEAGKLQLEWVETNVQELFSDVIGILSQTAERKGVSLIAHMQEDIPGYIRTDPTRLRQILTNVIGNAVKFTDQGTVEVQVSFDARTRDLHCLVRDTGPGIPSAHREKIFEPFVQGDASHSRQHGGSGLGLALSRMLSRALGGDLSLVSSEPGKGSVFRIIIPADAPATLHMPATQQPDSVNNSVPGATAGSISLSSGR